MDVFAIGDSEADIDGGGVRKIKDALGIGGGLNPEAQAITIGGFGEDLGFKDVLTGDDVGWIAMGDAEDGNNSFLQAVAAMDEGGTGIACGKYCRIVAKQEVAFLACVVQGAEGDIDHAIFRSGLGVEDMATAGIFLATEGDWLGSGFILDEEAVVGGEDEFVYADRFEVIPGSFNLLEPKLEGGGSGVGFSGIVDFFAVDDDELGFFAAFFEGDGGGVADVGEVEFDGTFAGFAGIDAAFADRPYPIVGFADGVFPGFETFEALVACEDEVAAALDGSEGIHAHGGDGREFGVAGFEVDGGACAFKVGEEFGGHFVAEGVDHEVGDAAFVLGERVNDLVVEVALLEFGFGEETLSLADIGEVLGELVGPLAVVVAELFVGGLEIGKVG